MYWAEADPDFELSEQHGFTQLQQMLNLRRQAESHAQQDNLYNMWKSVTESSTICTHGSTSLENLRT